MHTLDGNQVHILSTDETHIMKILEKNRTISDERVFFDPQISDLHDPYLMPDMDRAVERILGARESKERIVIFGDYDVDGVSATAILVRFLHEIGCIISYRLPHRVHDGYGLKDYMFDELRDKGVTLVITVDCGTRDVGPIRHAKSLGIDVIVTDHHAVPDEIPTEVIGILNPKRRDSLYPFRDLAGAGVAFKLLHALAIAIENDTNNSIVSVSHILQRYVDLASLGTVADCMPITGENRTITTLGLRQMAESESAGLRRFLEGQEHIEGNADIIGFQIGPRINAAGRMDTPLTALRWLLASEDRADEFFGELEHLNDVRKGTTLSHFDKASSRIDLSKPILFYSDREFEHGIIGLVAGRLTEMYNRPSIIMKDGHDHPLTRRKGDEIEGECLNAGDLESSVTANTPTLEQPNTLMSIGSCRAPEWCNLIELLDDCRECFVRYGGHRQAAGFTIETARIPELEEKMYASIAKRHNIHNLPKKTLNIESHINADQVDVLTLEAIDRFRPFGIGNPRPLWLLEDVTITECKYLGKDEKHLSLKCQENPNMRLLYWNASDKKPYLSVGNVVSLIIEIERNEWNGHVSAQAIIKDIVV